AISIHSSFLTIRVLHPVLKVFPHLVRQRVRDLERNEILLVSKGQGTYLRVEFTCFAGKRIVHFCHFVFELILTIKHERNQFPVPEFIFDAAESRKYRNVAAEKVGRTTDPSQPLW